MVLDAASRKLVHIIQSHLLLFLLRAQASVVALLIEQVDHLRGHEVLLVIEADLVGCAGPELLSLALGLLVAGPVAVLVDSVVEGNLLYFAVQLEVSGLPPVEMDRRLLLAGGHEWPSRRVPAAAVRVVVEGLEVLRLVIVSVGAVIRRSGEEPPLL